jgi:hypothetical protein
MRFVDLIELKIISFAWVQSSSWAVIRYQLDGHPVSYGTVILSEH